MNKISVKNKENKNGFVFGRLILLVAFALMFCADIFAQDFDHQISLNPRRLGNQLGVEVWIRTINPAAPALGNMTIPVKYNTTYLRGASRGGNQPSSKTDGVYNSPDMAPTTVDPYLPYYIISSAAHNASGFRALTASVSENEVGEGVARLEVNLQQVGQGGLYPADTGRGTFLGMLRFDIKDASSLTDAALTDFDFNNVALNELGRVVINSYSGADLTATTELLPTEPFTVRGITLLSPNSYQTINRYPAVPYASMLTNHGYPIYFERSGLATPDANGAYGTPKYAYKVEYSLDDGATFTETGRIAENRSTNSSLNDATLPTIVNGKLDYLDANNDYYITTGTGKVIPTDVATIADLRDETDGPGLTKDGYGGVLKIIWAGDNNFPYRSEYARLKITQIATVAQNSNTPLDEDYRAAYTDATRSGISEVSFVLGRIFFVQLNGDCQYLRSERNFSTSSTFTVEAWVNLNKADYPVGSQPGIVATSSGSDAPAGSDGGWMLYLQDGLYPAFRIREITSGAGELPYYLADIRSPLAIGTHTFTDAGNGSVVIDANHSSNWTHIAAIVNNYTVTLYVDGEQVAQQVADGNARPLNSLMPVWVGVNPNNNFTTGEDFFYGGVKEVKVWNVALSQEELRQYISGVPNPTKAKDGTSELGTSTSRDPKEALSIYANLQGVSSDLANNGAYLYSQDYTNNLNYFVACDNSTGTVANNGAIVYRPDGSHIKLTSPSCGEGVSNLQGKLYEIRWASYGIGSSLTTPEGGTGDIMIQITRDGGDNWFDAIGPKKYDSLTKGTFAVSLDNEEVEYGSAMWEPYNNVTLTGIANDVQGVFNINNNFVKTVRLRISGTEANLQQDIFAESGDFLVAPHFALVNRATTQVTIPASSKLNVTTQNAFMEAWIRPYSFPNGDAAITSYPIIVKKSADGANLHYALRLEPTGQLSFSFASYDSTTGVREIRTAYSEAGFGKVLLNPNGERQDSIWYHVGVHLNIPNNRTISRITFYVDGVAQTDSTVTRQLGEGIISESKNTFPTYLGYEPFGATEASYFDGEIKEIRFWRNNPAGFAANEADVFATMKLDNFIQGASTVRANELIQVGTTNYAQGLIAAYMLDGGSWVNNGADGTINVYPTDPELIAQVLGSCENGGRQYAATYPYIKLVEPVQYQMVGNTDTVRVRWAGFDYNRNNLVSFTTGRVDKPSDLGMSDSSGANDYYERVGNLNQNSSFINAMILPTQINPFEFQGAAEKSQFAGLLNMGLANGDVKGNKSHDEQGPAPSTQNNGRLQLDARANVNSPYPLEYIANGVDESDGLIKTLRTEGPIFSITPPSNFTVRLLLEGYHQGLGQGTRAIVGSLGNTFETNALRIRFYEDNGDGPGTFVPNTIATNKASWNIGAKNSANRNQGDNSFANVPFTLTEAIDKKYYVVVDHQNYLPVMSAFSAQFFYAGDDLTTWAIESGWDFQGWDGSEGNYMTATQATVVPPAFGNTFSAYMPGGSPSNDRINSVSWAGTPLNFNNGHSSLVVDANSIASMVGGDVIRDGKIDAYDRTAINSIGTMTGGSRFNLKGYGTPNAIDRTIVDINTGKYSSLFTVNNQAISLELGYPEINPADLPPVEEPEPEPDPVEGGFVYGGNTETELTPEEKEEIQKRISNFWNNSKNNSSFQAGGVDYVVSGVADVIENTNYVDVDLYIRNVGETWAMANASYPIKFDPAVLRFVGLEKKNKMTFDGNGGAPKTVAYLPTYFAPSDVAIDPLGDIYSIEVNFDAYPDNLMEGINVPSSNTYLGTLRFELLRNDESIFFSWAPYAAVLAVDGRDLTSDGTFEDIEPIIVSKEVEIINPRGGEQFNGGSPQTITWICPLMNDLVSIEYSTNSGANWTLINYTPVPITDGKYIWSVPFVNSNQCLVRIVNAATSKVLAVSKNIFSINVPPTEITRPSAADPMYAANAKDYIKWISSEPVDVYFEYSENGINGWVKVTDVVGATVGQVAWTVKSSNTCKGVIRMVKVGTGEVMATSEPFKVGIGSLALNNPKKGDMLKPNSRMQIKWTSSSVPTFNLEMSTDAGAHWTLIAENVKASTKSYNWTVPSVNSANVILRAVNTTESCLEYNRTGIFSIGAVSIDDESVINSNAIAAISPNPVTDEATVKINLTNGANVNIAIYDIYGGKVFDINSGEFMAAGPHNLSFNVSDLTAGVYIVRMQVGGTIVAKEFVKVK